MAKTPRLRKRLSLKDAQKQQRTAEKVLIGYANNLIDAFIHRNGKKAFRDDLTGNQNRIRGHVIDTGRGKAKVVEQWNKTRSMMKYQYGGQFAMPTAKQVQSSYKRFVEARRIADQIKRKDTRRSLTPYQREIAKRSSDG